MEIYYLQALLSQKGEEKILIDLVSYFRYSLIRKKERMKNIYLSLLTIALVSGCTTSAGNSTASTVPASDPTSSPTSSPTTSPNPGPTTLNPSPSPTVAIAPLAVSFGGTCPVGQTCAFTGAVEGSTVSVGCASGEISVVNSAYTTSTATESCVSYLTSQCNGLQSCSVSFTNTNCGGDPDVNVVKSGAVTISCAEPQPSSSEASEIAALVASENVFRDQEGQDQLVQGLSCALYTVSNNTSSIASSNGTYVTAFTLHTEFNQANAPVTSGLNIFPQALQDVYQTWYVLKCTGQFVAVASAYYEFDLTSDDGSILSVDGQLINLDGNHAAETGKGSKLLQQGTHAFELDYMQAGGYEQLQLYSGGVPVPAYLFYH